MPAQLVVLEGPDGVGKTTLAAALVRRFEQSGLSAEQLSFPGKRKSSIGRLVYKLHHDLDAFGITSIAPAALQTLHVAAHIDEIETHIRPKLESGVNVVLDRFWWSTYIYGQNAGINTVILDHLLEAEAQVWKPITPSNIFLLERHYESFENTEISKLVSLYNEFVNERHFECPVIRINNDSTVETAAEQMWNYILKTL